MEVSSPPDLVGGGRTKGEEVRGRAWLEELAGWLEEPQDPSLDVTRRSYHHRTGDT